MTSADAGESGKGSWMSKPVAEVKPVELRTDIAHSARIYDYFLGGKDNFPADRAAAEQIRQAFPDVPHAARQNRGFLVRAARYLVGEVGIRQFLDIGTGIPTSPNLHEVTQEIAPETRVVYVDNDPIVLAHARALLVSAPEGRTAYLDADLRDPDRILNSAEVRDTLDMGRPVALSLVAICHFIPEENDPLGIVRKLVDALPSGSALVLTYLTADFAPENVAKLAQVYRSQGIPITPRSRDEVLQFFEGLDLVDPGLQPLHRWRPDETTPTDLTDAQVGGYAGVAIKP